MVGFRSATRVTPSDCQFPNPTLPFLATICAPTTSALGLWWNPRAHAGLTPFERTLRSHFTARFVARPVFVERGKEDGPFGAEAWP
jgi:hypothetical protein